MMDYAIFKKALQGLSLPDNDERKAASKVIEDFKRDNSEMLIQMILQCLDTESDFSLRLHSVVILRGIFRCIPLVKDEENIWHKLSAVIQNQLKEKLIEYVVHEVNTVTRRNICDIISQLACSLVPSKEWNELRDILFRMVESNEGSHKESALRILGELLDIYTEILESPQIVTAIIDGCIKHSSLKVRQECLEFISQLVERCKGPVFFRLTSAVPSIMSTLREMCACNHEDLKQHLQILIKIADDNALFFKENGQMVTENFCSIALNPGLFDQARANAVEFLLCLAERKPKMAMKIPGFIYNCIQLLLNLMLDIKDEKYTDWFESGTEEEVKDEERLFNVGEDGIDRFAFAFEEEESAQVVEIIFKLLNNFLYHNEWHFVFVGIMAISQIAEYIPDDSIERYLENIVTILMAKLKDQDWRVRFAACKAIGQISLDHQPYLQKVYDDTIMHGLINVMDDVHPRVQYYAMTAFINFAEEVPKHSLEPSVVYLMQQMANKLSPNSSLSIREQAITVIAVIAGVIGTDFALFYNNIMPIMVDIIKNCSSREERSFRGKAIECFSIVGLSVGQEMFLEDAKAAMYILLQLSASNFESDDPVKEYMQHAMIRMCRLMKEHFVPYLPQVLPPLMQVLSLQPTEIIDDDSEQQDEDMTMVLLGEKAYALRTSLVEDQKAALEFIGTLAEVLEENFREHIQPCATVILPLLSYILSDDVKQIALNTMAYLIEAARAVSDKGDGDKTMLHAMVDSVAEHVFKNIDSILEDEKLIVEVRLMIAEATGLNECFLRAGPGVLPNEMIPVYVNQVFKLLDQSATRRKIAEEGKNQSDIDEDGADRLEMKAQEEQALRSSVLEILGTLMQHYKQEFLTAAIPLCLRFIGENLGKASPVDDKTLAIYLCDDMLKYFEEASSQWWNFFMPSIMDFITDPNAAVRQASCCAITHASKVPAFAYFANEAAQRLCQAVAMSISAGPDESRATVDHAVAALGDCVKRHRDVVQNAPQYIIFWLNHLPLKEDEDEGVRVHSDLMVSVMNNDTLVLGQDESNLTRLVIIFIQIYSTDFSDAPLNEKICSLIKQVGDSILHQALTSLTKEETKQLERIRKDTLV